MDPTETAIRFRPSDDDAVPASRALAQRYVPHSAPCKWIVQEVAVSWHYGQLDLTSAPGKSMLTMLAMVAVIERALQNADASKGKTP
ncbi:hypothetical protein Q4S45_21405 [Massilia sp. R2A-15]|uniref:hypothetical protein n=1 Tax=Massilia sp. R2A-15 TaxID=3064278 RepID=UPI002733A7F3|nr:hypothetical protein [Massilia sp. R2A-15]WLI89221.1 hypothetical protein Q4S45_21405 [Massilia sp. R2A-15]